MDNYDALKLENQLCFPLYAASREVIKRYTPFLKELDLTYTQYIVMMVLWQEDEISVKELGCRLFLDSGTLTPVLKSLEGKGCVTRRRSAEPFSLSQRRCRRQSGQTRSTSAQNRAEWFISLR